MNFVKCVQTDSLYNKILFIHIPKTAGTSVNHVLSSNRNNLWKRNDQFNYHDPLFVLERNNPEIKLINPFIFSIVRNPYDRIFSCYRHFNYRNNKNISFTQYLEICSKRDVSATQGDINFWKTPMIFFPQSLFLYNLNGKLKKDNIYKFENLSKLERKLSKILKKKIYFPRLNFQSSSEYQKYYTYENIETVKELYSIDFENFGYSTDFL